ncbi:hypothetical protein Zmor_008003 [Zophobas morio]|uniref:Calcineurin-like phosphoesterase domain-containing protein n=1 Tax=Zophobas morio TaxID=2755281 RepID=A0AA38J0I1_9CUCU|nr:hypothetical protein Zmor_008003 [Zophobas morio]
MESAITVHPLSHNPTEAFTELSKKQKFTLLQTPTDISTPVQSGHVRIVCMSDTHSEYDNFTFRIIPDGDIFIHAGDFSMWGEDHEIIKFNNWIKSLPHRHKVVIAGNHELSFDEKCIFFTTFYRKHKGEVRDVKKLLTDCIYLEDSAVTLCGLKIYGSPWQPEHGGLAFNLPRGQAILEKWNQIPEDVDILVTHGPPLGHGDRLISGGRAGCVELLSTIQKRVKPKFHIFGHIHEGYGISTDGTTTFVNACTCNRHYVPRNLPIVFDIDSKDHSSSIPKHSSKVRSQACVNQ